MRWWGEREKSVRQQQSREMEKFLLFFIPRFPLYSLLPDKHTPNINEREWAAPLPPSSPSLPTHREPQHRALRCINTAKKTSPAYSSSPSPPLCSVWYSSVYSLRSYSSSVDVDGVVAHEISFHFVVLSLSVEYFAFSATLTLHTVCSAIYIFFRFHSLLPLLLSVKWVGGKEERFTENERWCTEQQQSRRVASQHQEPEQKESGISLKASKKLYKTKN